MSIEIHDKIKEFNQEMHWDQFHSPEYLAYSIAIDSGELLECFQWNNEYDLDEVKEELADVINYCLLMADKLGVDPKQIVLEKMEKTAKKYPVEKAICKLYPPVSASTSMTSPAKYRFFMTFDSIVDALISFTLCSFDDAKTIFISYSNIPFLFLYLKLFQAY